MKLKMVINFKKGKIEQALIEVSNN